MRGDPVHSHVPYHQARTARLTFKVGLCEVDRPMPNEIDLSEFRDSGRRLVDLLADLLARVEETPLFPEVEPRVVDALFDEPLPRDPAPLADVVRTLEEKLLPYCVHVNHP